MRTLVGRPARLEAHLAAQAAALAHDVVSHLDLLFQPSASALYVAAPRSGSPRRTTAAGSGGGTWALATFHISSRMRTHAHCCALSSLTLPEKGFCRQRRNMWSFDSASSWNCSFSTTQSG